ncbi:hypothetical protein BDQ12DRAFT_423028 [Crucibulum laeve]|uniref:Uncharacterized protein n=1 Tax=Crucibulum laeve TaxID=68775 RepID=A0A5C3M896_9AGAR|nr:hypothetical protein BDQ12DRAFT_423028 [Crucibulum laeve]
MPAPIQTYEVLLDFTNDLHDSVTVQLLRDYGRNTSATVLLHPTDTVTLVLESGSVYHYAIKTRSKVANVTARSWRDMDCPISHLFAATSPAPQTPTNTQPVNVNGISVDRVWRDHRCCIWNDP